MSDFFGKKENQSDSFFQNGPKKGVSWSFAKPLLIAFCFLYLIYFNSERSKNSEIKAVSVQKTITAKEKNPQYYEEADQYYDDYYEDEYYEDDYYYYELSDNDLDKCKIAYDEKTLTLTAPDGEVWGKVNFASYGTPYDCGEVSKECHLDKSVEIIAKKCLGKEVCEIKVGSGVFDDPCPETKKRLAVSLGI